LEQRHSSHAKQGDANWRNHKHRDGPQRSKKKGRINGVPRLSCRMRLAIDASIEGSNAQSERTKVAIRADKRPGVYVVSTVDTLHGFLHRWSGESQKHEIAQRYRI